MNLGRQVQINSHLSNQRNILAGICTMLLCSNLMLAAFVVTQDSKTILLPMDINRPFTVSGKTVSEEYIELIARDLIQNVLNITPQNYEYAKRIVLKLAHPSFYGTLNQQLDTLLEDIKKRQVSIHFLPIEMKIIKEELLVEVSGYLETRIGVKEVGKAIKKYRLGFDYTGSQLTLKEFYEVKDET